METANASAHNNSRELPDSFRGVASIFQSRGGEHLGDLVWWTLSDARIDRAFLEQLWGQAGLSLKLLPKPPSAEKALKTAVRECQVGKPDVLFRLGKESDAELVFAILRETRDAAGNVDHQQEARVILSRATEHLVSDTPHHPESVSLTNTFHELRHTHTPDDVRLGIVKALHDFSAVTLRETGGVYWVPRTSSKALRRLQSAIEQIGRSRFYLLPVHETAEGAGVLADVARGSIEEELASLQAEIAKFKQEPPDRASTLERRLETFNELRARANLYRDILNVQVQDLDQQLHDMAAAVQQLLSVKQAA